MSAQPDLIGALVELIGADPDVAALVNGRVFGGELPEDEQATMADTCPPTVVVQAAPGIAEIGQAFQNYGDRTFELFCYGPTPHDADLLWRTVHPVLKNLSHQRWSGCLIYWIKPTGQPIPLRDPDTQWPYTMTPYQTLAAEIAVT